MANTAKRLRKRLREAVATSDLPQVQRGSDVELEESVSQAERDLAHKEGNSLPDKSYPIRNKQQLHSAAVLASSGHGDVAGAKKLIRRRAKELGVDVTTLPGFGKNGQARESLRILIREATVTKTGNAYEVTIVREGPGNPGDANYYTKHALREAVTKGMFEGLQAYLNHPTPQEERDRPERDVRFLAGHFREARYQDGPLGEVRAKFIPGGMDKDRVVQLIESALASHPDRPLIGISIDGYGHAPDQKTVNGRTYNMVREVTHLGSADIVTRAGAGGRFHRRLQEAWRNTGPAERRPDTSQEERMKPAKLQETVEAAVAKLEEAAGLDENDAERADELVSEAVTSLKECATAELDEPKPKVEIREVEKPVAASDDDKDQLAAQLATTEQKLREAESDRDRQRKRRKDAETERDTIRASQQAAKVMREAKVPAKAAGAWFDEIVECDDVDAMKRLVERKMEEREEMLSELRESAGVIEGAGPRAPSIPATPATGGLLDRMGIDRDELAAA